MNAGQSVQNVIQAKQITTKFNICCANAGILGRKQTASFTSAMTAGVAPAVLDTNIMQMREYEYT